MMPLTVLVAEDDRFLRRATELTLKKQGLTVLLAEDGRQALDLARSKHPDLILLDLLMPHLSGIEVLRALRASDETSTMRVVILSNSSKELEMHSANELGVLGYWIKSNLSLAELRDRVLAVLAS